MRPISPTIRRHLARAGLWDADSVCLPCGRGGQCTAEHALYVTPDGRQGMGARQMNAVWAIIPACWQCNVAGEKALNAYCALLLGKGMDCLTEQQAHHLEALGVAFKGEEYDAVRRRVAHWQQKLKETQR